MQASAAAGNGRGVTETRMHEDLDTVRVSENAISPFFQSRYLVYQNLKHDQDLVFEEDDSKDSIDGEERRLSKSRQGRKVRAQRFIAGSCRSRLLFLTQSRPGRKSENVLSPLTGL